MQPTECPKVVQKEIDGLLLGASLEGQLHSPSHSHSHNYYSSKNNANNERPLVRTWSRLGEKVHR